MKHLIVWLGAALVVTTGLACGGHTPQAAAPKVAPAAPAAGNGAASRHADDPPQHAVDKKSMCKQAMSHVLDLVEKEARPVTSDERARFMREGVKRCMADDVPKSELRCIAAVKSLDELDKCEPSDPHDKAPDSDPKPDSRQAPPNGGSN